MQNCLSVNACSGSERFDANLGDLSSLPFGILLFQLSVGLPRRHKASGTPLSTSDQPNDLWCADYKGEFMLADRRYCYPLTITDFASR